MTPQEACALANALDGSGNNQVKQFIHDASFQDILAFIHCLDIHRQRAYLEMARATLDVRLAENAAKQAERLEKQIVELVSIAAEQKRLAAKLDMQTDRLIALTVWLKRLTIGLLILTLVLCIFEALHFIEARKNPVQTRPHMEQSAHDTQQNTNR